MHTPARETDVDCADVHAAIASGRALSSAEAAHVEGCAACRVLVQDGGALGRALARAEDDEGPGRDALWSRVQGDLQAEQGMVARMRAWPTSVRVGLAAIVAAIVPALSLVLQPRPDLAVYPPARLLLDVLLFAIPAALALWISLRPLHRRALPSWSSVAAVGAAALAMLVLVLLPEAHRDHVASLQGRGEDFGALARACFVMGVACGIPALVWLRLSSRDAGRRAITGALAATAALAGGLAVFLHCPIVAPSHLLAGHATVLVPYLLLAWATARRR